MGELLKEVGKVDPAFENELRPSEILTDYAIAYRYPEEGKVQLSLTPELGENAYKRAVWVFQETKNRVDKF